jgi:hypothetical protein
MLGAAQGVAAAASWSIQAVPAPVRSSSFMGVSCPTTSSCIAVGSSNTSISEPRVAWAGKWDGTTWTVESVPAPPAFASYLTAVSCVSPNACTAVGYAGTAPYEAVPLAARWDGTAWTLQSPAVPAIAKATVLNGVTCASATDCMAVGRFQTPEGWKFPLAEHWDGHTWSLKPVNDVPNADIRAELFGVSCSSADACTAVGDAEAPLALRWNGLVWAQQLTDPLGSADLFRAVSCPQANACTAVGASTYNSFHEADPVAERWNGATWTAQQMPKPPNAIGGELDGVSCPKANVCTAVGNAAGGGAPFAEQWTAADGWTLEEIPLPNGWGDLSAVSCPKPSVCTAVGAHLTKPDDPVTLRPFVVRYERP